MVRGGRCWTVYLDGGPEMAPKPPHVRSAPAEPWRCSGVVGVVRGPEMAPKPPRVRSAPAEPWRCSGVVGVRARPRDGPHTFAAPRRSRGAALERSTSPAARSAAPDPPGEESDHDRGDGDVGGGADDDPDQRAESRAHAVA